MRNKTLLASFILLGALAISSCGSAEQKTEESTATDSTIKAPKELTDMTGVTSYYECPMKCEEKKFAEAGNCPVCGMELVLVEVKADSTVSPSDTTHQM